MQFHGMNNYPSSSVTVNFPFFLVRSSDLESVNQTRSFVRPLVQRCVKMRSIFSRDRFSSEKIVKRMQLFFVSIRFVYRRFNHFVQLDLTSSQTHLGKGDNELTKVQTNKTGKQYRFEIGFAT